jgi:type I restriction enzyme S subunit
MRKQQDDTTTGAADKIALVPKLRFPGFLGSSAWESAKFGELVDTVTPPKKLSTSSYSHKGAFPIIDQSQNAICGWTDDHDALIKDHLPLVIFGGHTCILKLVYRAFAQGADGIKIIKPRSMVDTSYIYQYLKYQPVVTEEYKRHYSILKEKVVLFPDFKTGEQQKIADCLSSLDELIAAQTRKVDALKTHKKGLMQQIFPREGETQPRLRFPEFRDAGKWSITTLGKHIQLQSGYAFSSDYFGHAGRKLVTPKNFTKFGFGNFDESISKYTTEEAPQKYLCRPGDLLVLLTDLTPTCELLGKPLEVSEQDGNVLLNQRVAKVELVSNVVLKTFFKQFFLTESYNEVIVATASGSTVKHSSNKVLLNMEVALPCVEEQKRIADCLTSLDTLITAATQELGTLKTHKKGLMQQLFPSAQAVNA